MHNNSIANKFRELGKHGLIYGVGTAIESLLNFILIPLFLNKFPPDVFGAFALIQLTAGMAAAFFYFGGSSALSRFYFDATNDYQKKILFSNSLYITLLGAIIMCTGSFLFRNSISERLIGSLSYANTVYFLIISASFSILNTNFFILLRLLKKSVWFILLKLFSFITTLGFIFLFIGIKENIAEATALGYLVGNFAIFLILTIKLHSSISTKIDLKIIRKYLHFGTPLAISGFLYIILDWSVRYFVKKNLGLTDLGLFSMGLKIGALLQAGYIIPFSLIWSTIRIEYRNDKNTSQFFNKVASFFLLAGISIIFFISVYISLFLRLISNNSNYEQSLNIIPIMLLSQLILGTINILDYGIYINNKTYYYIIFDIIALIVVSVLSYLLIKNTGIFGASVINLTGYLTLAGLIFYKSNTFFAIKIDYWIVCLFLINASFFYGISNYLNSFIEGSIILSFLNSTAMLILFGISAYFSLRANDRQKINDFARNKLQFFNS